MTAEMNRMIREFVSKSKADLYKPISWHEANSDQNDK